MTEQSQGEKTMKNWKRTSSCLLAAAVLSGCAAAGNSAADRGGRKKVEIFPENQMHYCPVKFEKISTYVILISNGFINGGWIWRMQNIVFV